MKQPLRVIFFLLISCIAYGQKTVERVDGITLPVSQTYWSSSIPKKESSANNFIRFYQKYISGIRGNECPMYPSCSNFGMKTFSETDFATAFLLTSERLMRCGHDYTNYSLTLRENGFRYIDYPSYDSVPENLYYKGNSYYFAFADSIEQDSSLLFIRNLMNNGYYDEALLEIMRLEFKSTISSELFINKIICLRAKEEFEKVLYEYETKCPASVKQNPELLFQVALTQYKLHNFQQALEKTGLALKICNSCNIKPKLYLLNGLVYANQLNWTQSEMNFKTLLDFDSYKRIGQNDLKIIENALHINYKNPTIAGLLAVIPGLGYAYTGHRQTAITAFALNGILGYATFSNFKNKNYGMGILTGLFSFSFYTANIYGSAKSARRHNQQQQKNIIDNLEYNANF